MKQCPFCAEDIQDDAIRCKHCSQNLVTPWYFKTPFVVSAFLIVGPFALPLLWWHPTYTKKTKIMVTVMTIFLTIAFGFISHLALKAMTEYYELMSELF